MYLFILITYYIILMFDLNRYLFIIVDSIVANNNYIQLMRGGGEFELTSSHGEARKKT